jgi:hypothetical protein
MAPRGLPIGGEWHLVNVDVAPRGPAVILQDRAGLLWRSDLGFRLAAGPLSIWLTC